MPPTSRHDGNGPEPESASLGLPLQQLPRRIIALVLSVSVALGGLAFLLGYPAMAKGFILGSLFSALNFLLMAIMLPLRLGCGRSKSVFISLASIIFRFAVMAIPLIVAAKNPQFAVASTIVGLFMVQITLVVNQVWRQRSSAVKA